jgi:hypothetical protein
MAEVFAVKLLSPLYVAVMFWMLAETGIVPGNVAVQVAVPVSEPAEEIVDPWQFPIPSNIVSPFESVDEKLMVPVGGVGPTSFGLCVTIAVNVTC